MPAFTNGPDQVLPSQSITNTEQNGSVKLRIPDVGTAVELVPPRSVPTFLNDTVKKYPNHIGYCYKKNPKDTEWINVTYTEYLNQIRTCAKAFLKLGLEKHHSVCIIGFNSPEWLISDLAAIYAGGIAVGIYTTNSAEACFYCCDVSKANIIIVEDEQQLVKIQEYRHKLPNLKAVVQFSGECKASGVISWQKLMEMGQQQNDSVLEPVLKSMAVNQACTMVFTSGTVGNPKAVLLSHDNLIFDATAISEKLQCNLGEESIVSYLPLSHVAAQIIDIYIAWYVGGTVYFADKNALKGSLVNTLLSARPTKFIGVPRVWEKMHERLMVVASQNNYILSSISSWAKYHCLQNHLALLKGEPAGGFRYTVASLILRKVKLALGFDRCTHFFSAAAPLSPDIKQYFLSLDIPVIEAFGMSECAGAHTLSNRIEGLDTLGPTVPGLKTKIFNPENGQGEICMYGRHIFMGYLGEAEKTTEAIDEDGWLHSGDLGKIDNNGLVYITGRLKELLITAGGENVPPVPIEQQIITELPHLSFAFLVGDQKKFLSLLVTLKTAVDPTTNKPLDDLLPEVQNWLNTLGCPATTVTEVLAAGPDPRLLRAIQDGIDRVNAKATSNAQKIQKFAVLPRDFSIPTGELGPTLKVKRRIVAEKYSQIIENFYH